MAIDHEFAGISTDLKLSLVEGYLSAYTTALRNKFEELWYIDAFAGTGEITRRLASEERDLFRPSEPERIQRRRGSAKIAIETNPPFDRLVFIEKRKLHYEALVHLKQSTPDRNIDILHADANTAITEELSSVRWSNKRGIIFLDPYGMNVEWSTLENIRATEALDVWYLVSISGLFRQAARRSNKIDEKKHAALTRMLGTKGWLDAWYEREIVPDLLGELESGTTRTADIEAIERFVFYRLSSLFPKVLPPLRLKNSRNVPTFSLFFLMSNPNPQAIGLATRIANHILKAGKSSQIRSR